MNQAILFNDDFRYDETIQAITFTGLLAGQLITIYIQTANKQLDQSERFNYEAQVEEWLEDNEPDSNNEIRI